MSYFSARFVFSGGGTSQQLPPGSIFPHVGKHRLHHTHSSAVVEYASLGIKSFDHFLYGALLLIPDPFDDLGHLPNLGGGFPDASTSQFAHTAVFLQSHIGPTRVYLPKAIKCGKYGFMDRKEAVETIRSFNRFYTNVIGVVDRHILDSPFSLTEVRILWEIDHNREYNARRIKAALHVDEGYLSRTISKLLRQGLIYKQQSENDRRVYTLSLSKKGKKTFLELNRRAADAIAYLISSLSDREVTEIVTYMRGIEKILRKGYRANES